MRITIAAGLSFLIALTGAGCAHLASRPAGPVHAVIWSGWIGFEQAAFEKIVRMFNEEQKQYYFENRSVVQDDTRVFRAITAGTPPDVFFLWRTHYIGALAANGAIMPLDDLLARSSIHERDFSPGALDQARYRGKLWGIPFMIDASALFWNRDILTEAGLDPNRPPRTLEELLDMAVRLTKRDARGNLVRLGFQPPPVHEVIGLFGGQFVDPATGEITANYPRNVEALEWYLKMFDAQGGGLRIDSFQQGFGAFQSANHQFFVGKVAMMVAGEWWPGFVTRYSPTTDYGVVQLPYPSKYPEKRGSTFMGGNFACIPTEARHPQAAWAFVQWMQSRRAQVAFSRIIHNVPNMRCAILAPELISGNREKEAFGTLCRIVMRDNCDLFPPSPVNVAYQDELESAAQRVVRKTATPREALDAVQSRLEEYMEPYRGL